jgi:mono/diheme cytochrome c family protein
MRLTQSPTAADGALLYQTHCIGCHGTQIHWRDDRLAKDWTSLAAQVRRWQTNTGLHWSDEQIDAVARHLNDTIYHFPDHASRQAA